MDIGYNIDGDFLGELVQTETHYDGKTRRYGGAIMAKREILAHTKKYRKDNVLHR